jgi:alpha-mannosidase
MSKEESVYVVPFSHLDLYWAGAREECLSRGGHIINTALNLLECYPEYRFTIEAVNFMDYYLDAFPEELERIKKLLQAGQLEIIPMRSITYTQLPSGETLVRNLLYGREFCMKKFGIDPKIITMSDIPGITPQMPQIALLAGMNALVLSHGCPPHTDHIKYYALDSRGIDAYAPPHYGRCFHLLADGRSYDEMLEKEPAFEAAFGAVDYKQLCQLGVDLCVITEVFLKDIMRWNEEGHRKINFTTYKEFFDKHIPPITDRISGEIPSLWPNVESSWPDLWPLDLPCENAMFNTEFFSALNILQGRDGVPAEQFKTAWNWLLDGMDHNQNGIGGVYADKDKLACKMNAKGFADQYVKKLAWRLAAGATAPRAMVYPIVIFNSQAWERSEVVKGRTVIYGDISAKYLVPNNLQFKLIDHDGNDVPFKTVTRLNMISDSIELEFMADKVPAFGAKVYYIVPEEPQKFFPSVKLIDGELEDKGNPQRYAGMNRYENDFFILEIDRVTGELNLFDKVNSRQLFNKAGIVGLEEKRGDYICNMDLTGRIVPGLLKRIELVENNAVLARIKITGSVYGHDFEQIITMEAARPVVGIENKINWRGGSYVRLEQTFPFASQEKAEVRYGVPFGAVRYPETIYTNKLVFSEIWTPERGSEPDREIEKIRLVSKWISIGDSRSGIVIGCDHRMWEIEDNTLRNCMLRGIGQTSGGRRIMGDGTSESVKRPPAGEYTSRFKITLTGPNEIPDGRCGYELNSPLYPVGVGAVRVSEKPGLELPVMPDCTGSSVLITNVKPSEKYPDALIFRAYEGQGADGTISLPQIDDRQWLEVDLMEENERPLESLTVRFKPFEIKTLLWKKQA